MTTVESEAVARPPASRDRSDARTAPDPGTRPPPTQRPVVDAFVDYLKEASIEAVFGLPGGLIYPFFDAVERDDFFDLVITKHEEGAAFMADGYARATHSMAVCAATSGPGATNMLTGVGVAFSDNVPLLVLTGQAASNTIGKGAVQEAGAKDIDIVAMFEPVTKYSARVEHPEQLLHHLRRALRLALTGRPGPVHLNVPVDFWRRMVPYEQLDLQRHMPRAQGFDPAAVDEAARVLIKARHPVILAGGGVRTAQASDVLIEVAEQTGARVATTPRGKGVFPEDHPQSLGVFGYAGQRVASDTVLSDEVDVLMVVGSSLNEMASLCWRPELAPAETFIQIDIDPDRIGRNYAVDLPLLGDARAVLAALGERIGANPDADGPPSDWPPIEASAADDTPAPSPSDRITPQQWRAEMQAVLPDDALIYSDVGGHMLFNIHELRIGRDQDFILNLGFGSMGHGTVAAIGAARAVPERAVVAIVGDACFAMNGMELLIAVEHDIPVVWIVENNQMHGVSWHSSKAMAGYPLECIRNRRPVDIAAIAAAMGVQTHVVEHPGEIQDYLRQALAEPRRPTLIDVRVDPSVPPPVSERTRALEAGNDD